MNGTMKIVCLCIPLALMLLLGGAYHLVAEQYKPTIELIFTCVVIAYPFAIGLMFAIFKI